MNPHHQREEPRMNVVDKVCKARHKLVPEVLVDERARKQVAALEVAGVEEETQNEDHDWESAGGTVFGEGDVAATKALQAFFVHSDHAATRFRVVIHGRLDGGAVAGSMGGDDEVCQGDVLQISGFGLRRGDAAVGSEE